MTTPAAGRLAEKPFHADKTPGVVKLVPPIVRAGEPLGSRLAAGEAEMVGVITGSMVERADADGEGEAAGFPVLYRSTLASAMVSAIAATIPTVEASGDGPWPATALSVRHILSTPFFLLPAGEDIVPPAVR